MNVYFIAPYIDSAKVRRLHLGAREFGITPVSKWAEEAIGPETLEELSLAEVRATAEKNDRDLASAHVVVVLSRNGSGGEMFAEARLALTLGIPVLWVGERRPLSAYREGVLRVDNIVDAMENLEIFARMISFAPRVTGDAARAAIWSFLEFKQHEAQNQGRAHAA